LEQTSICVVDEAGAVVLERRVATEPEAIAAALATLPTSPARVLLETGSTNGSELAVLGRISGPRTVGLLAAL
jgi:hypothetical protein